MFSKPDSARISDTYVAVRLLGGNDLDEEGKAFVKRFDVGGYPTLMAMTPDGAVLSRNFGERTIDAILGTMSGAAQANTDFLSKEKVLKQKAGPGASRELAGLYMERAQYPEARARLETLVSTANPALDDQLMLLSIVERLGENDARKALLQTLVENHRDDERHIQWRMDLATSGLATQVSSREELVTVLGQQKEILGKLLTEVEKPGDQAVVRSRLASALARTGELDGAIEHWGWIVAQVPTLSVAAEAMWILANQHYKRARDPFTGNLNVEELEKCRALLKQFGEHHGSHPLMNRVTGALKSVEKAIADAKEKPEPAKADDGG